MTLRLKRIDVEHGAVEVWPLESLPADRVDGAARFLVRRGKLKVSLNPDSTMLPTLNGMPVFEPRGLVPGDVVNAGVALFVCLDGVEAREPSLEAVVRDGPPSSDARWVYADWLAERGDPLGVHVSKRGSRPPTRGSGLMEGLWADAAAGAIHLDWRGGYLRAASIRAEGGTHHWSLLLAQLCALRAAFTLKELAFDFPALVQHRQPRPVSAEQLLGGLERAVRLVERTPVAATLERLVLGYHVAPPEALEAMIRTAEPGWRKRLPKLADAPMFLFRPTAELVVEAAPPPLLGRVGNRTLIRPWIVFERPARPSDWPWRVMPALEPWSMQPYLRVSEGRWVLGTPDAEPVARVNGLNVGHAVLLHGDRLEFANGVVARVELRAPG